MQNIEAQVNEYLQVHTNKYYFSGSVLIAQNGNILISKGYGMANYELAPNFIITITKENDQIFAQATAQSQVEIYPKSETEFFYTLVYAQITFVKNEEGEVTLILHQNGQEKPAKKIK